MHGKVILEVVFQEIDNERYTQRKAAASQGIKIQTAHCLTWAEIKG